MNPPEALAFMTLVLVVGFFVIRPIATALAKRIAGEHRKPEIDPAEKDELLSELQQVRQEVAELAERMDFAERLLARKSDAGRLQP